MNQKPIGTRIAELRKEKGLTQTEVVEKCNVNIRTLQRIESNQVTPRMYTVRALLEAMEYDLDVLNETNKTNPSSNQNPKETHFFDQTGQLFNQNKRIMKKAINVLGIVALCTIIMGVGYYFYSMSQQKNQLVGTWKIIKSTTEQDQVDLNPRLMKFDGNIFYSLNKDGSVYNGGKYMADDEGNIVTIHAYGGDLCNNSNYYKFKISQDTMTFTGYFLRHNSPETYRSYLIDEVWVKVEDIELKEDQTSIADVISL